MYSLSLSVATPSAVVSFEYTTTRVSSDHNSHTFYLFCFCVFETVLFFVVCGGLVFLFFVAPSFAVFSYASVFNRDLSKWNTSAVTTMYHSKCTLSSLSVATPSAVVYFECTTTRVSSDHTSHTFCYFCFVVWKRYSFCCLWWVGLSFLCCTLFYCSVPKQRFQTNTVRWQMAIFVFKQLFDIHRPVRLLPPWDIHVLAQCRSIFNSHFLCVL